MAGDFTVSEVRIRFYAGESEDFLGWASCLINGGLFLNDVEIRRSREGCLYVRFPTHPSKTGVRHHHFCPVNRETRAVLEEAILGKFSAEGIVTARRKDGEETGRT